MPRSLPRESAGSNASPGGGDAGSLIAGASVGLRREVVERRAAVSLAGHVGDATAVRSALADPAPTVRIAALHALVRHGWAAPENGRVACADPDPLVRAAVCELAPNVPGADYRSLLADTEPAVVEAAAYACGECADATAVEELVRIATDHADPLCREAAVAALGAIGEPAGKDAVLAALNDVPAIRRRAVVSLAAFDGSEVEAALTARLEDRDWQVRQAAEDVLGPDPRRA